MPLSSRLCVCLVLYWSCASAHATGFATLQIEQLPPALRDDKQPGFVGALIDLQFFRDEPDQLAETLHRQLARRMGADLDDREALGNALTQHLRVDSPSAGDDPFAPKRLLLSARDGDRWAQALLAWRIERAGDEATAAALIRAILDASSSQAADSDHELLRALLLRSGLALARDARDGEDIVRAMGWLARSQMLGHPAAREQTRLAMEQSSILPPPNLLDRPAPDIEVDMPTPAAGTCPDPGVLNDPARVLALVAETEAAIAADPQATDSLVAAGRERIIALGGPFASNVTFRFDIVPLKSVLALLADANDLDIGMSADVDFGRVGIHAVDAPGTLVFARLAQAYSLVAACRNGRLHVDRRPDAPDRRRQRPLFVVDFLAAVVPAEGRDGPAQGTLRWHSGMQFTGAIDRARPAGPGEFTFAPGSSLRARIIDDFAQGPAVLNAYDAAHFEGIMLDGLPHGRGHWREASVGEDFDGQFTHGRFTGNGRQGLAYPHTVVWQGPFIDGQRQGPGTCEVDALTYPCTFAAGRLSAIGAVSLDAFAQ